MIEYYINIFKASFPGVSIHSMKTPDGFGQDYEYLVKSKILRFHLLELADRDGPEDFRRITRSLLEGYLEEAGPFLSSTDIPFDGEEDEEHRRTLRKLVAHHYSKYRNFVKQSEKYNGDIDDWNRKLKKTVKSLKVQIRDSNARIVITSAQEMLAYMNTRGIPGIYVKEKLHGSYSWDDRKFLLGKAQSVAESNKRVNTDFSTVEVYLGYNLIRDSNPRHIIQKANGAIKKFQEKQEELIAKEREQIWDERVRVLPSIPRWDVVEPAIILYRDLMDTLCYNDSEGHRLDMRYSPTYRRIQERYTKVIANSPFEDIKLAAAEGLKEFEDSIYDVRLKEVDHGTLYVQARDKIVRYHTKRSNHLYSQVPGIKSAGKDKNLENK